MPLLLQQDVGLVGSHRGMRALSLNHCTHLSSCYPLNLSIVADQAQMRGSLHAHILAWFHARRRPACHTDLEPIHRETKVGTESRQRPRTHVVPELREHQEDNVYHYAEVGRISTEMCRPHVTGTVGGDPFGGFNYEKLRIAGVARAIQTRLALHSCTLRYCLEGRSSCRFFFPWPRFVTIAISYIIAICGLSILVILRIVSSIWPQMPYQCYDEHTERVAGMRRLEQDDQYV